MDYFWYVARNGRWIVRLQWSAGHLFPVEYRENGVVYKTSWSAGMLQAFIAEQRLVPASEADWLVDILEG